MRKLKILEFPFCNLNAFRRYANSRSISLTAVQTSDEPSEEEALILPGVGSFNQAIDYLDQTQLLTVLKKYLESNIVIGICLGMQILLTESEESPGSSGLSVFSGACRRIPSTNYFRVPHVGWNQVHPNQDTTNIFSGATSLYDKDYYFVHSFYCDPSDRGYVSSSFIHPTMGPLPASIELEKRIYGFQFHPEKSGRAGYALLDQILL